VPSLFPRYEIEVYGRPAGDIVKDLSYFQPRYIMDSLDWEVLGSISSYDYELSWQNTPVACCRPQEPEATDALALEFFDRTEALPALGVILVINCLLAPQTSKLRKS
jgi:uncharacterized protein YxjI